MNLTLIGYWREFDDATWWMPQNFVDKGWESHRRGAIVEYLKQGVRFHEALGLSFCRYHCGMPDEGMGNAELTDGMWFWPEGLVHYVEQHDLVLPSEFVDHMVKNHFRINSVTTDLEEATFDFEFWRAWCAKNSKG